jgi:hypothetical protein
MKRRTRLRRVAKWAGMIICVLVVGAWVASLRWMLVGVNYRSFDGAGLRQGGVVLALGKLPRTDLWHPWEVGWTATRRPPVAPLGWWPFTWEEEVCDGVFVPLWMLFAALALPTGFLWWRDRRRVRAGHCSCGYSLSGLAPGAPCPECGKAPA